MDSVLATSLEVKSLPVNQLKPNPWNRTVFDPVAMEELVASIRSGGIEEPLIVRPVANAEFGMRPTPESLRGTHSALLYEIASGHRRWLAAQKAGLPEVPCLIKDLTDEKVAEMNIEINVQRENLPVLELARMVKAYMEQFEKSQQEAATRFGKSQAWVSDLVGFLKISPEVLKIISALIIPWNPLMAIRKSPPGVQLQIAQELSDGSLKPDKIEDRCNKLRFSSPSKPKSPEPAVEATPDPLAEIWPSLKIKSIVAGQPWGVTYAPQSIPELNGVSMPTWQFWVANNNTLTPRSDLKRWFLQMAEAMGDTSAEDAEMAKHGLTRNRSLADLVAEAGGFPVPEGDAPSPEEQIRRAMEFAKRGKID